MQAGGGFGAVLAEAVGAAVGFGVHLTSVSFERLREFPGAKSSRQHFRGPTMVSFRCWSNSCRRCHISSRSGRPRRCFTGRAVAVAVAQDRVPLPVAAQCVPERLVAVGGFAVGDSGPGGLGAAEGVDAGVGFERVAAHRRFVRLVVAVGGVGARFGRHLGAEGADGFVVDAADRRDPGVGSGGVPREFGADQGAFLAPGSACRRAALRRATERVSLVFFAGGFVEHEHGGDVWEAEFA